MSAFPTSRRPLRQALTITAAIATLAVAGLAGSIATSAPAEAGKKIYVGFYGGYGLYRPYYASFYRPRVIVASRWAPCPWNIYRLCRY